MAFSMSLAQLGTHSPGVALPVSGFSYSLGLLVSVCNGSAHWKSFMDLFYFLPKAKLHPNGGHGNSSDVSLYVYLVVYYYCPDTFTRYSGRELV